MKNIGDLEIDQILPESIDLPILNISSRNLSSPERMIMWLNSKFIPMSNRMTLQRALSFDEALKKYHRTLLLRNYFVHMEKRVLKKDFLYLRTVWTPENQLPKVLQKHYDVMKDLLEEFKQRILNTRIDKSNLIRVDLQYHSHQGYYTS